MNCFEIKQENLISLLCILPLLLFSTTFAENGKTKERSLQGNVVKTTFVANDNYFD